MAYRKRIVDDELARRLSSTGAVVIEGPKACGKTATARQLAASEVLLDVDEAARKAMAVDPALVLAGAVPRLIDEWQNEPAIWNHIRRAVDTRGAPGQFILTGSAVPTDDITRHGGAGRLTRLRMRPMSLFETGHATGAISVKELLGGASPRSPETRMTVAAIAERISVGGWPGLLDRSPEKSLGALRDYIEEIRRADIQRVDQKHRDPDKVDRPQRGDLRLDRDARRGCRRIRGLTQGGHGRRIPRGIAAAHDRRGPASMGTALEIEIQDAKRAEATLCRSFLGRGRAQGHPGATT